MGEEANELLQKCIVRLEYTPTNCQIYMQELTLKFLPILYRPDNFSLHEIVTWSLDRYGDLMKLCQDNCYNYTLSYAYRECTSQLPIARFFPEMSPITFSALLTDLAALLCHTNPAGDSCLLNEAELVTGRVIASDSVRDACLVRDALTSEMVLPAQCAPVCREFLLQKRAEYGCCITSWTYLAKYSTHLSKLLYLYPDQLYKLLEYCEIEPPSGCPYTPDLSNLSTGLITFLSIAGALALLALAAGIVKNLRDG